MVEWGLMRGSQRGQHKKSGKIESGATSYSLDYCKNPLDELMILILED